jgi:hypothetical protein
MGGMGGMGGFGGGFFSVPDHESTPAGPAAPASAPSRKLNLGDAKPAAQSQAAPAAKTKTPAQPVAVDASVSPDVFWDRYFQSPAVDAAAVRASVRKMMGARQYGQVITLVHAALRNGQPQPWMYETLGIAMELDKRPQGEIERAVMSAVDFSSSTDELMYIAEYLTRIRLDRRALKVYQQVAKLEPLRGEAYAFGLRAAQRCGDLAGVEWATVGVLSQAWPTAQAEIERTALRVARDTLDRLEKEGKRSEYEAYLARLQEAIVRDVALRVSWTGNADVDVLVQEPAGSICSLAEPRTIGGGVILGDSYVREGDSGATSETYICPRGFAGTYRIQISKTWGEIAAGKVTVDVVRHLSTGEVQRERRQIELGDEDAIVAFELDKGRRTEPLEAAQLAGAVSRQQEVSRAVLAQQLSSGADESVLPIRRLDPTGQIAAALLARRGGGVGFMPVVQLLPSGTMLGATGVVSADRRYVRITPFPNFTTIGNVQTFTFAGPGEVVEPPEEPMDGEDPMVPINLGGGGFGGR